MAEYLSCLAQIRGDDFDINTMYVPGTNETLVAMQCGHLSVIFTQERFAKFAADVAAFAAGGVAE